VTTLLLQLGVEILLTLLDPFFWVGVSNRRDRQTRDRKIWQATELR
jgi:hypothetical protein